MLRRTQLLVSCALGALLVSAGAAAAQSTDRASPIQSAQPQTVTATADATATDTTTSTDTSTSTQVGEVMVTARLRAENIQKVPQNVVSITPDLLISNNVVNYFNLNGFAPSVDVVTAINRNYAAVDIRGFAAAELTSEVPGVSYALYDMSNVQILYGPQGTLFGYTALGGAVLYTPTHPKMHTWEAGIDVTLGNLNMGNYTGYLNIPLVEEHLAMRIAFERDHTDGYVNLLGSSDKLDSNDNYDFRISMQWNPLGGRFTNYSSVSIDHQDDTTDAHLVTAINPIVQPLEGPNCPTATSCFTVTGQAEAASATPAQFLTYCSPAYLADFWPAGTTTTQCENQHLAVLNTWGQQVLAGLALTYSSGFRAEPALPENENIPFDNVSDFITLVDIGDYKALTWNGGLFNGGDITIHNIASTTFYRALGINSTVGFLDYYSPLSPSGQTGFAGDAPVDICYDGLNNSLYQTANQPQLTPGTTTQPMTGFCGYRFNGYNIDFTDELQIHGTLEPGLGESPGVTWVLGFYNAGYPEPANHLTVVNVGIVQDGASNPNEGPFPAAAFPESYWAAYLGQYFQATVDAGMFFRPLKGLHFTGGVRLNEVRVSQYTASALTNASPYYTYQNPVLVHALTDTKPINWSASVDYTMHDLLIYANTSYIVVPGFANAAVAAGQVPGYVPFAGPENLNDYEGGVKWNFNYDNGVRGYLDADLYYEELANVQIANSVFNAATSSYFSFTSNPANLFKKGVELQGEVFPVPNLDIYGNFSYADDYYTDYFQSDPEGYLKAYDGAPGATDNSPLCDPTHSQATVTKVTNPTTGVVTYPGTCILNFSSTRVPNAPYVQASLRVKYNLDLGNVGVVVPSLTAIYMGKTFFGGIGPALRDEELLGPSINAAESQAAYALVNMRLEWQKPLGQDKLTAAFFVTNLFNKTYVIGDLATAGTGTNGFVTENPGPPREYGFEISAKW